MKFYTSDNILQKDLDKEEKLRHIFVQARKRARNEVNELLADFRTKRAMGLFDSFLPNFCEEPYFVVALKIFHLRIGKVFWTVG